MLAGAAERQGEGAAVRGHPEAGQHRLELLQRRPEVHGCGREVAVFGERLGAVGQGMGVPQTQPVIPRMVEQRRRRAPSLRPVTPKHENRARAVGQGVAQRVGMLELARSLDRVPAGQQRLVGPPLGPLDRRQRCQPGHTLILSEAVRQAAVNARVIRLQGGLDLGPPAGMVAQQVAGYAEDPVGNQLHVMVRRLDCNMEQERGQALRHAVLAQGGVVGP